MATLIEDFPHHNAHYANDDRQAMLTIFLTAVFVIALCMAAMVLL
jgi:hypothetical protein